MRRVETAAGRGVGARQSLAALRWIAVATLAAGVGATALAHDATVARVPVAFVENRGQWHPTIEFGAVGGAVRTALTRDSILLHLEAGGEGDAHGVVVGLVFEGVGASARLRGEAPRTAMHHFYFGADPSAWRVDVPSFASTVWRDLYPGVDVRFRHDGARFEYDLLLEAGACLDRATIRCDGVDGIALAPDGSLLLETALGTLRQPEPRAWCEAFDGSSRPVAVRYRRLNGRRFGFVADAPDPGARLVIDPGLEWSTLLGGSGSDSVHAMAQDPAGGVVLGTSASFDFLPTPGAYNPFGLGVQVARLSADGATLVYAASFNSGVVSAITVDATGVVTLAGRSGGGWPTTPGAYDVSFNGGYDAFVSRLSAAGSSLLYSTFYGGLDTEHAFGVSRLPSGETTIAGFTGSAGLPVTPGAFDTTFNGGEPAFAYDAFVARLNASGSGLAYSTFLGGAGSDYGYALAAVGADAIVVGQTSSPGFPVTQGVTQPWFGGIADGFVSRLDATGANLVSSTFLGGEGLDRCLAVAAGGAGGVAVAGEVGGTDFPVTPGAFDTTYAGGGCDDADAFIVRFDPTGAALAWATLLGGAGWQDTAYAVSVDATGVATVAGWTGSPDFPTTAGAFDTAGDLGNCNSPEPYFNVGGDAFVSRLTPDGAQLLYSTFLGGAGEEIAYALTVGSGGATTVAGQSMSVAFPTTPGAYGTVFHLPCQCCTTYCTDAFVTRLDMLPAGAAKYGASTPGCAGPLAIGVSSIPQVGNAGFGLTCTAAPTGGFGALVSGGAALASPVTVIGADLWVDLSAHFSTLASADAGGWAVVSIPIPQLPALAGFQLFAQFGWLDTCAPAGVSASNALAITFQP